MPDIIRRIDNTFSNERYIKRLSESKKNWLDFPTDEAIRAIRKYMASLEK